MAERDFREVAHPKKRAFLVAYAKQGTVTHAAIAAKITRRTHSDWMHDDPDFPAAFEQAMGMFADRLEEEATRRAIAGTEELVFYQGEVVGHHLRHSDTLLIFMLKGARPDKYRDQVKHQHAGDPNDPTPIAIREVIVERPDSAQADEPLDG